MNYLLFLLVITHNIQFLVSAHVTLYKNDFISNPESTEFKLKCEYHLEGKGETVQRVDISKDGHIFYSVEYNRNKGQFLGNNQLSTVTKFKKGKGIDELVKNTTHEDHNLDKGWASVNIKRGHGTRPRPQTGTYRCKVHYLDGNNKHKSSESDKVYVVKQKEEVKLKMKFGRIRDKEDIKIQCKYELLKKDKFEGLTLIKDKQEFLRFYGKKNHTFTNIPGIDKIDVSSHLSPQMSHGKIYLKIKKATNLTAGYYGCKLNFSNPYNEDKVITLSDMSTQNRIWYKNSKESHLSKTWIVILLLMTYVNY